MRPSFYVEQACAMATCLGVDVYVPSCLLSAGCDCAPSSVGAYEQEITLLLETISQESD